MNMHGAMESERLNQTRGTGEDFLQDGTVELYFETKEGEGGKSKSDEGNSMRKDTEA